jgi:hypothetical protein
VGIERGKFFRRRGDEVNFGGERLVERRVEAYLAEPEACEMGVKPITSP